MAHDVSQRRPAAANGQRAVADGDVRTAISDGLVALLKEYYGRGPEQAKTYVNDDLVVCLLRGGFTPVEQTLKQGGYGDADTRLDAVFEQAELDSLLHMLDERERTIVVLYFHGGMTQKQIGSRLGLSQMHISRLLRQALQQLQREAA